MLAGGKQQDAAAEQDHSRPTSRRWSSSCSAPTTPRPTAPSMTYREPTWQRRSIRSSTRAPSASCPPSRRTPASWTWPNPTTTQLRKLAKGRGLPLIDFEKEILKRRPNDWNGTLLGKNDVHPTGGNPDGVNGPLRPDGGEPAQQRLPAPRLAVRARRSPRSRRRYSTAWPEAEGLTPPARQQPRPAGRRAGQGAGDPRHLVVATSAPRPTATTAAPTRLKLKSNQEMSLIDIDPAPLRGRVIRGATLHVRSAGEPHPAPRHGRQLRRRMGRGHLERATPRRRAARRSRTGDASRRAVDRARQRPVQRHARAGRHDCGAWPTPRRPTPGLAEDRRRSAVVAARVAGISYGFLLFDDTGSEWTRDGEKFTHASYAQPFRPQPRSRAGQRSVLDRLSGRRGQDAAGRADRACAAEAADLPAGEAWVSWITPKDEGPAGTRRLLRDRSTARTCRVT